MDPRPHLPNLAGHFSLPREVIFYELKGRPHLFYSPFYWAYGRLRHLGNQGLFNFSKFDESFSGRKFLDWLYGACRLFRLVFI